MQDKGREASSCFRGRVVWLPTAVARKLTEEKRPVSFLEPAARVWLGMD
jgi:hypothetical protein